MNSDGQLLSLSKQYKDLVLENEIHFDLHKDLVLGNYPHDVITQYLIMIDNNYLYINETLNNIYIVWQNKKYYII